MIEVDFKKDPSGDQNVEVSQFVNLSSIRLRQLRFFQGDSVQLHIGWVCVVPPRDC